VIVAVAWDNSVKVAGQLVEGGSSYLYMHSYHACTSLKPIAFKDIVVRLVHDPRPNPFKEWGDHDQRPVPFKDLGLIMRGQFHSRTLG
jgi:hypothetical protein